MFITEKDNFEEEENSTSSNNENEFKELDNEIEKVIRGDTSYEDEKIINNDAELNNSSNTSQNSSKYNNNLKTNINNNKIVNNHDLNVNDTNKKNNSNIQYNDKSSKSIKNIKNLINVSQKSVVTPMMNSENKLLNEKNNNFLNNYSNYLINNKQNNFQMKYDIANNNNSFQNLQHINLNLNNYKNNNLNISSNTNNNNLQECLSMNNKNPNGYINYQNNINNINNINNNNFNFLNNNNINNNLLLSNMNYYFYISQLKEKALCNNMPNNMVIYNQFLNQNNNLQFNNTNINNNINSNDTEKLIHLFNIGNNLIINGFEYNINNNNLSHNIQINTKEQKRIFPFNYGNNLNNLNNTNINNNNIINNTNNINNINNINNTNDEIICKLLDNHINSDLSKNIKKKINNNNIEKNHNNSNKRKIFNPLPDSEKEKNIINLMDILQCRDLRTTLMIKNIPNKYTISSFLKEINNYFKNTYDIFYLPIDYINKCNLGFAFINFVEPFHIILFYDLYYGKKWKKFNSDKICELLYAKFQGRKELISHFEKGKVLSFESEEKRPLILPKPNPLPKIYLPIYYLDLFLKLYPYMSHKIKIINNNKNDKSEPKIFSINGNFHNY